MRESITNILSHLYKENSENSPLLFITLWVVGWWLEERQSRY
jgi:hypothetical protein